MGILKVCRLIYHYSSEQGSYYTDWRADQGPCQPVIY